MLDLILTVTKELWLLHRLTEMAYTDYTMKQVMLISLCVLAAVAGILACKKCKDVTVGLPVYQPLGKVRACSQHAA